MKTIYVIIEKYVKNGKELEGTVLIADNKEKALNELRNMQVKFPSNNYYLTTEKTIFN